MPLQPYWARAADSFWWDSGVNKAYAGNYPIERSAGEIERLHVQAAAMAPDTLTMLERIGVKPGWACLDVGCGPGGITGLMSACVGPAVLTGLRALLHVSFDYLAGTAK
jgi:hypothetical protein